MNMNSERAHWIPSIVATRSSPRPSAKYSTRQKDGEDLLNRGRVALLAVCWLTQAPLVTTHMPHTVL